MTALARHSMFNALLVTATLLASAGVAQAQTPRSGLQQARGYAPIFWLAPGEPAYPMRPFPFAFDGIDNDEDGCYDLDDADEIDAIRVPAGGNKDEYRRDLENLLMKLGELRVAARSTKGDPAAAVRMKAEEHKIIASSASSRGTCVPRRIDLKNFKLCEEFAGHLECGPGAAVLYRFQETVTKKDVEARALNAERLLAIQYWLYYPWDDGHLHDGEHVSVFVSPKRVEAVVGAGHLASTANNVLARIDGQPYPTNIPAHMPILIEMGKHSSAPDLNCNGLFDIGQDSNYLPSGVWGTRDINYAVGKSQWGKYELALSFDRARGEMLIDSQAMRDDYIASCSEHSLGGAILRAVFPEEGKKQPEKADAQTFVTSTTTSGEDRHAFLRYRLINAEDLKRVLTAQDQDMKQELFAARAYLFPAYRIPWQTSADVTVDRVFEERVKEFREAESNTHARPDIWSHSDYGKYGNDFKASLFRTWSWGPSFTVENGNSRLGAYVRFAPKGRDSSWELHFWQDRFIPSGDQPTADANAPLEGLKKRKPFELAVLFNSFSTGYRGLYGGLSYRVADQRYSHHYLTPRGAEQGSRSEFTLRTDLPWNVFVEAGYSIALPIFENIPLLPEGLRQKLARRPLQIRIGVAGPLMWREVKPTEAEGAGRALRADNWQQAVELRVNVQFRLSNIGRHFGDHPLQPKKR